MYNHVEIGNIEGFNKIKACIGLSRSDHIRAVKELSPWAEGDVSDVKGGAKAALELLDQINPRKYGFTRNHLDGAITHLSPYIRHGVVSLNHVRNYALAVDTPKSCEKFIQQLAWRDYWQRLYRADPTIIWRDAEAYKTGFSADDYANDLPDDIINGQTGVACIDYFIRQLVDTGFLHNHARLYLAAYICHWRRVKWQAGARWFLSHLLDGDPASNNMSFQWVASTFSNKPYYYNLENVAKFSSRHINTTPLDNQILAGSYDEIYQILFPNLASLQRAVKS